MAKEQKEIAVEIFDFARTVTPLPIEREQHGGGNMVVWGDDNLYPNFLLGLYDNVPLHSSIINSKVDYLIGDGMVEKATGKPLSKRISDAETNDEFANKIGFDYVLFGWFVVAVQYNVFGRATGRVYHVPGNKVRSNRNKTKFWVCDDWNLNSMQQLSFDAFKEGNSEGGYTKMYMYKPYVPSVQNVYPKIKYGSSIINMVTERLINDFSKGALEDGFSAETILSFFKGVPTTEQGKKITDKIKAQFSGPRGKKLILDFNNPPTNGSPAAPATATSISKTDYTGALTVINNKNETNILASHQAPSRALFAIEQAAGLNGNDLETAYAIFKNVWVKNNRNNVESGINALFLIIGIPEVEFKDRGFIIPKSLSDTTKEKVYTKDELRAIDGLPPLADGTGGTLLEQPKAITADNSFSRKGRILTETDFESVKELGSSRDQYTILDEANFHTESEFRKVQLQFDDASDIENYLLDNDVEGKTPAEIRAAIRKELGIVLTTEEVTKKIAQLKEAGVLPGEPKKSITRDVKVLYEYVVRPGFGAKIIAGTRGFCKKLIENDRLYERSDIQQMSAIFGYDVFKHCGGWYYNSQTEQAENQCRHEWKAVRAIKKQNNG